MPRETYPLTLAIASILLTSLGLAAAVTGLKWGAAPASGDALSWSWVYVHVMWALVWLIVWPALALRPAAGMRTAGTALWEGIAIATGAIPAVTVAGFLSGASPNAVGIMLGLQMGSGMLMFGLMQCRRRFPTLAAGGTGVVAGLTLAGPIGAFLWTQFFPQLGRGWFLALPLVAVGRAGTGISSAAEARVLWSIAALQMLIGLVLASLAPGNEKAPGTEVPRA